MPSAVKGLIPAYPGFKVSAEEARLVTPQVTRKIVYAM